MTKPSEEPTPPTADDHDEQALRDADEKLLLRDKEHVEESHTSDSSADEEHDKEAQAEADRRMLRRDDRS
jgi:hypothetical protein